MSPSFDLRTWQVPARFTRPALDSDEGGLWAMMDREETRLRRSPFRIRDEPLDSYLTGIAKQLAREHADDLRLYPIRTPYFNANMAPNGMMQVWSGLLLRMDNESQLAAVIGHEIGHFLQRHSLEMLRDAKQRSAFMTLLAPFGLVGAIGQMAALAGMFGFSREHERQADAIGIVLMRGAGYDAREAAKVWSNLLDELRANPDADPSRQSVLFATHPPSDERRDTLQALAANDSGQLHAQRYRERLSPLRLTLIEDEIRRARSAESLALFDRLLVNEPNQAQLLYGRGEVRRLRNQDTDRAIALADFEAAVRAGSEPAATHRSLGHMHRAEGRKEQARQSWTRYLELAPDAADAALIRQYLQELSA